MTTMLPEMLERFDQGLQLAIAGGLPEPGAMTVASVNGQGVSARTVLLKSVDEHGFVFYTNLQSHKGRQIQANPNVALVFWWRELERQVLVEGVAGPVAEAEADAYFAGRPRGSQIGAWASLQSSALPDPGTLVERVAEVEARFQGRDVPRPSHWSGFRVRPVMVEFWYGRPHRLHERVRYELADGHWRSRLLYP